MKLTKLSLVIFLFILTRGAIQSQDMTVTLGTNGVFIIKDATTNWLALNANNGQLDLWSNLRLEKTGSSSTQGVIFKETDRFIHDFRPTGANGYNTFIGTNSGNFTMSGSTPWNSSYNTGVGTFSLTSLTLGFNNTAVGYGSLYLNTEGTSNTAVGMNSMRSNTIGQYNTALGFNSLSLNTTGCYNTAVGWQSLLYNTTGSDNTAVGLQSLLFNTTGYNNTAVGKFSLNDNTTGYNNTALGFSSGNLITTGNNLTCLGFNANPSSPSAENQITLGDNYVTQLRCNVTTITALSDARDKKNIRDLNLGLDFLMNVKPRLFNWDRREWYEYNTPDGSKMEEKLTAGFIAQELDEVQKTQNAEWLNLVLKDNPEKLEATPGNLLPIMVKAIQELKIENDKLKEKLNEYEQMQNILIGEIEKLKIKEGEVLNTSSR